MFPRHDGLAGDTHLHTAYTDGQNSVAEMCRRAVENGLSYLVFSEHVRQELDYSFAAFANDVREANARYDIDCYIGCEAKVLDTDGTLDLSQEVYDQVEIVIGVFHSFPYTGRNAYIRAIDGLLSNSRVDVWGHPLLYAQKTGIDLTDEDVLTIVETAATNDVVIEYNRRYDLPSLDFLRTAIDEGVSLTLGSDAHDKQDVLSDSTTQLLSTWIHRPF
jgi:putative hydrolase